MEAINLFRPSEASVEAVAIMYALQVKEVEPYLIPDRELWAEETRMKMRSSPGYIIFLAELNGHIIGYVDGEVFVEAATGMVVLHARGVWVYPDYRSMGVAIALIRQMSVTAAEMGAETVYWTVSSGYKDDTGVRKNFRPVQTTLARSMEGVMADLAEEERRQIGPGHSMAIH